MSDRQRRSGGALKMYNAALLAAQTVGLPASAAALLCRRRTRAGLRERLGFGRHPHPQGKPGVWLHAVSVGEVAAAAPVAAEMRRLAPGCGLVISTVTSTGRGRAAALFPDAPHFYAPLDLSWVVARVVEAVSPDLYLSVDTDLWPNLTRALSLRGVPIVLINGRVSDASFQRWQRARGLAAEIFSRATLLCMQTGMDAGRAVALGARAERVLVTGSTKYDAVVVPSPERLSGLRGSLGLAPGEPLIVGGSTHAGEERALLEASSSLLASGKVRLALVPRHPERAEGVAREAESAGWKVALYGAAGAREKAWQVLVVDRVGVLGALYGLATAAFVGKSLCGAGGQNPLEPAALGVPVVFGPAMDNFREQAENLVADGAAVVVRSTAELAETVGRLLGDASKREAMGRAGVAHVASRRGASARCAEAALGLRRNG